VNNYQCHVCGAGIYDAPNRGYVTGCQHEPVAQDGELIEARRQLDPQIARLERELAESAAQADITTCGHMHPGAGDSELERFRNAWWRAPRDAEDRETFETACRYLRLRGLLEEHENGIWMRPRKEVRA